MILEIAPVFILNDLGENTISLTKLKGKIVILDFLANSVVLLSAIFWHVKSTGKIQKQPDYSIFVCKY